MLPPRDRLLEGRNCGSPIGSGPGAYPGVATPRTTRGKALLTLQVGNRASQWSSSNVTVRATRMSGNDEQCWWLDLARVVDPSELGKNMSQNTYPEAQRNQTHADTGTEGHTVSPLTDLGVPTGFD